MVVEIPSALLYNTNLRQWLFVNCSIQKIYNLTCRKPSKRFFECTAVQNERFLLTLVKNT